MTVYVAVPYLGVPTQRCRGCAADSHDKVYTICTKLSRDGCVTHDRECAIWIEDTEAARIAYITLKLES